MIQRLTLLSCFVLLLAQIVGATDKSNTWSAGVARVDITPDAGLWMSGYASRTKPAEGKLTDLWVKALALEDGTGSRAYQQLGHWAQASAG